MIDAGRAGETRCPLLRIMSDPDDPLWIGDAPADAVPAVAARLALTLVADVARLALRQTMRPPVGSAPLARVHTSG